MGQSDRQPSSAVRSGGGVAAPRGNSHTTPPPGKQDPYALGYSLGASFRGGGSGGAAPSGAQSGQPVDLSFIRPGGQSGTGQGGLSADQARSAYSPAAMNQMAAMYGQPDLGDQMLRDSFNTPYYQQAQPYQGAQPATPSTPAPGKQWQGGPPTGGVASSVSATRSPNQSSK